MFSKAREVEVPVVLIVKRSEPISKLEEIEALPDTVNRPPRVRFPEAEAVVNSRILNWVEAAEKVQLPDIV